MPVAATDRIPLTLVEYESLYTPSRWAGQTVDWSTWAAETVAAGHRVFTAKDKAPLWGLYCLRPGGGRSVEDVQYYSGICIDLDGTSEDGLADVLEGLTADGVTYLAHTSWSHGLPGKGNCWRVLVPLARQLPLAGYPAMMAAIKAKYAPGLDTDATQRSQAFYLPSCAAEDLERAEIFWSPGAPLEIMAPVLTVVRDQTPEPVNHVTRAVWEAVAKRWAGRTDPQVMALAERLRRVCEGVRFASAGERDSSLWRLVSQMVRTYPDASADSVAELFQMSLHRMAGEDGSDALTEYDVREKLERARAAHQEASSTRVHPERRAAIGQAFGSGRTAPYTEDEIETWQQLLQVTADQLERLWILQHGKDYYLLGPGGSVVQCQAEALANKARVVLAPAPIDLHVVDKTGRRPLTREELLARYSTPLESVELSLADSTPRVNLRTRVLTLPACPRRALTPRHHPAIGTWLQLLAGGLHYELLAWLQFVPDLSRPLAALVLTGPKGTGKSLLSEGVARIWSETGVSDLRHVLTQFAGDLMRCPYVTADEGGIPRDAQGREKTEDLRQFVQATRRQIDRKHRELLPLKGAGRLQISSNNQNVLELGAELTGDDVDAIASRFLHVTAQPAAEAYLQALGGRPVLEAWVDGDQIAEHVLWLEAEGAAEWAGRFGLEFDQRLVDRMLVQNGVRSQLCEIFVRALRDRARLMDGSTVVVGQLAIRLDWILDSWETWQRKTRQPSTSALLRALDGLSERVDVDGDGWFLVRTDRIAAWAESSGLGSASKIAAWLESHAAE